MKVLNSPIQLKSKKRNPVKGKKHFLPTVLESLAKKSDCKVDTLLNIVYVLSNYSRSKQNDLGNKSWGKIDFLISKYNYKFLFVKQF